MQEERYTVIKISDMVKYLDSEDMADISALLRIITKINRGRLNDFRGILKAVVVESDWPMYNDVWKQIEEASKGTE